jgi:hypothetical protein
MLVVACGSALAHLLLISPPSVAPAEPVLEAAARLLVEPRTHCLSLQCRGREWHAPPAPLPLATEPVRTPLPGARHGTRLRAPATPRESSALYSNDWRIGSRYGVQLVREPGTQVGVQFGAGYRLAPRYDDGTRAPGPVLRSELSFARELGERARWRQRVLVESGRGDVFVRQAFALDIDLWPSWTLETDYVVRRDGIGGSSEGTVRVLRRF